MGDVFKYGDANGVLGRDAVVKAGVIVVEGVDRRFLVLSFC